MCVYVRVRERIGVHVYHYFSKYKLSSSLKPSCLTEFVLKCGCECVCYIKKMRERERERERFGWTIGVATFFTLLNPLSIDMFSFSV